MHNKAWKHLFLAIILGTMVPRVVSAAPTDSDRRFQAGTKHLTAGEYQQAFAIFSGLIDKPPRNFDLAVAMVAAGRASRGLQQYARAREYFDRALERSSPKVDPIVIRLAAAEAAFHMRDFEHAISYCEDVLASKPSSIQDGIAVRLQVRSYIQQADFRTAFMVLQQALDRSHSQKPGTLKEVVEEVTLQTAAKCMTKVHASIGFEMFQWYLANFPEGRFTERSKLGVAWSAGLGVESPEQAAARLSDFRKEFPNSSDTAAVCRAEADCWFRAKRPKNAMVPLRQILVKATDAGLIRDVLDQLSLPVCDDVQTLTVTTRQRIMMEHRDTLPRPNTIAAALRDAAVLADEPYWQTALDLASRNKAANKIFPDALQRIGAAGRAPFTERLVTFVLGKLGDASYATACEGVCKWCAESKQWTFLALAANNVEVSAKHNAMTPNTIRLLAEALIQSGQNQKAGKWFDVAVEEKRMRDFSTLIRRAELFVALKPMDQAKASLQEAAKAVRSPRDQALVDLLISELQIRRAELKQARKTLMQVVRQEQADSEIRCRAQWLIGETFLLQNRFSEAVDAYRLVETLQPTDQWKAAALVQAGKAFEKMGRDKEAGICYDNLLHRFADSVHAGMARDRLATIRNESALR